MFDRVSIRSAPATVAAGYAGLEGSVYGITTPSVTGVVVIGDHDDVAVNVDFGGSAPTAWFAPDLVERLDQQPGQQFEIAGRVFTKVGDGAWIDSAPRPWWRFW